MGNKENKIVIFPYSIFYGFYLELKNILLVSGFIFQLFAFSHIHNIALTLTNAVKLNIENDNTVSTLSNFVNNYVEIYIVQNIQRWFDVAQDCKSQSWRSQSCFNLETNRDVILT